ncbi:MAG: PorT family protein [Bacteroidales bacterium]|nr:PorT family protein [Bacteroidales bacterium]
MRIFILFLLIFFFTADQGYSQRIKGALIAGFNATQVDGDEVVGYNKLGLNVGAAAIIPFKKKWSFSIENVFSQKGSHRGEIYIDSLSGSYTLRLNYVEVPVLVHFTDKEIITVGSGFSWGRLVGAKEWEHGQRTNTSAKNGPYDKNEFSWLADLRFRIWKRLKFNLRFSYSLAKIRTRKYDNGYSTWERKQYNNALSFRLLYIFNERLSEKVSSKK